MRWGEGVKSLETPHVSGLGAFALLAGRCGSAMRRRRPSRSLHADPDHAHLQLAALSTAARQDVDYAALDAGFSN